MLNLDYFFTYKNSLKFLILLKLNQKNYNSIYSLPFISKLNFFFSLSKVTDKDNIAVYIIFIYLNFFLVKMLFYLNLNLILFRYLIL